MGVCNCSIGCYTLLYVHSSFAIILIGKRKLVALLSLSSWCLLVVVWLFLAVPWVCLRFVIVVFPDHTHLLFLVINVFHRGPYESIEKKQGVKLLLEGMGVRTPCPSLWVHPWQMVKYSSFQTEFTSMDLVEDK